MLLDSDCPKHVELIRRSIKLLLLHLFGHLYYAPTLMRHGQTQIKCTKLFGRKFTPIMNAGARPNRLVIAASEVQIAEEAAL